MWMCPWVLLAVSCLQITLRVARVPFADAISDFHFSRHHAGRSSEGRALQHGGGQSSFQAFKLPPTPCGYLDVQVSVSWQAFHLTLMCCLDSQWVFCADWQLWRHHPAAESGQESERPVGRGSCRTHCWGGSQCGPAGCGTESIPPWGLATGEQRRGRQLCGPELVAVAARV